MSKPKSIEINIPHPCAQSWDEMKPSGNGRHCAQCNKSVIDFTTWSDDALYNFFSKNKDNVCGRFIDTQLSRPIHIPYQPHSRLYRITIALGLTLIFAQTTDAMAQNSAPKIEQTSILKQRPDSSTSDLGSLSGRVVDDKKEPIISAAIQVFQNGILVGGNVTDYDGNYVIKPIKPGNYDVLVLYVGYDSAIITNVTVDAGECTIKNAEIYRHVKNLCTLGGVMFKKTLIDIDNPTKRVFTNDEIRQMPR